MAYPVVKEKKCCKYDLISLGEVMLRFDPGEARIRNARTFKVWEGGGEYNVARGLSSCFYKDTAIVTSLVDNEIGRLISNLIQTGGVDISLVSWEADDGIGESARNGLYFWERGFGVRTATGASDRANTAVSHLKPGVIDWDTIFGKLGVRWFHTGGIFAGLSISTTETAAEAMKIARKYGTIVSYDLNYRPSLWQRRGGKKEAERVNGKLIDLADILFGVESMEQSPPGIEADLFKESILKTIERHTKLKALATTMRYVKNVKLNDWSGLLWLDGQFYEGTTLSNLEIFDRVGGGDGFAAGLIYGFLENRSPQNCIDYAVAHGALTMTTPGDNSMMTVDEVERFMDAGGLGFTR